MIQILPIANVIHQETVLKDNFESKFEGWELIEVKKHTGNFIQGFSEYSIAILAPKGFSKLNKLEENVTYIKIGS